MSILPMSSTNSGVVEYTARSPRQAALIHLVPGGINDTSVIFCDSICSMPVWSACSQATHHAGEFPFAFDVPPTDYSNIFKHRHTLWHHRFMVQPQHVTRKQQLYQMLKPLDLWTHVGPKSRPLCILNIRPLTHILTVCFGCHRQHRCWNQGISKPESAWAAHKGPHCICVCDKGPRKLGQLGQVQK